MKTWLASFQVDLAGECFDVNYLIQAGSEIMAEACCRCMGQNWWPAGVLKSNGCYWQYRNGDVWLKQLWPLCDAQAVLFNAPGFLDTWKVSGDADAPLICDLGGAFWQEFR